MNLREFCQQYVIAARRSGERGSEAMLDAARYLHRDIEKLAAKKDAATAAEFVETMMQAIEASSNPRGTASTIIGILRERYHL